jgi:hypothetical protein
MSAYDSASVHISFITGRTEDGRNGSTTSRVTTEDSLCFLLNGGTAKQPDVLISDLIKANLTDLNKILTKARKNGSTYHAKTNSLSVRLTALSSEGRYVDGANFWCSPVADEGEGYFFSSLNVSGDFGHSKEALKTTKIADLATWVKLVKTVLGTQVQRCIEVKDITPILAPAEDIFEWIRNAGKEGAL